ncbi:hypothetical protein [Tenacibaculum aestuariivivum]|uniref:hypothetical protein n=1 Tax=Tenacibaculum aestuariivivum TaxID=2006131 RepID=UPI003AB8909E
MNLGSTIVGVIIIIICIVPFILMNRSRKKRENKMLISLKKIAEEHKGKINQHEFCGDFVIGIDENKNFVFFFKQKKEKAISQFVDLSEIEICKALKSTRTFKNLNIIERVELSYLYAYK